MTQQLQFLSHLQSHVQASFRQDPLQPFREESWSRLQILGLASKALPAFRYVPLRDLYSGTFLRSKANSLTKASIQDSILPESTHSHLVFVDGFFSAELSDLSALPSDIVFSSLEQALVSHAGFLRKSLSWVIQKETDPFALLNLSLSQEGVFFYVPPQVNIQVPVQVLYVSTGPTSQMTAPRLHLVLGSASRLSCTLTSSQLHKDPSHFSVPVLDVTVESHARLHLFHTSSSDWAMQSIHATLKKHAYFSSVSLIQNAAVSRQNYWIELKEEGSEADLSGLALLDQSYTAHTHVLIEHQAPHTRSMQLFKGVLNDLSRSSFSGKIFVHPQAQKTQAYQLNKTLLLSPHALVSSEPNLEIGADDVKASHGSTIATLDDKQLFYFNTRGIDRTQASQLLIQGFCKEILERLHSSLRKIPFFR